MLVRRGLQALDMEIREADAQAAEHWDGEPEIMEVLQQHSDTEEWMQKHIEGILRDWSTVPEPEGRPEPPDESTGHPGRGRNRRTRTGNTEGSRTNE